ncbi:hypothetical protein GOODEAATRI_006774 [Goodea atripinnis]|uniref:Protein NDRG2 n=1 Tax=Goodea atripinnis TaxID=208336 RepID=A0ABV0MIH8_9TELE
MRDEHDVETPHGMIHVVIRGAPKGNKPAILTYHDVGLNREYLKGNKCCQMLLFLHFSEAIIGLLCRVSIRHPALPV